MRLGPIDLKPFMVLVGETPCFEVRVMKIMSLRIRKMLTRTASVKVS